MSITSLPSKPHSISLSEAIALTKLYRAQREELLKTIYQQQNILPLSETFNREAIDQLLAQPDCQAIRLYYGMDVNMLVHVVVVGVNAQNQDMLPLAKLPDGVEANDVIENSFRCPDICPPASVLNS